MRAVAALRHRDGLSQADLAARIGTSQQAVAKWEIGTANPKLKKLFAMADVFDCTLETLLGRQPIEPRRLTLEEKMLEFKALEESSPAAANVDALTRTVFEEAMADPEKFQKRARAIDALQRLGQPESLTELIDTILAA